jgi:MoaA/NifB/PqqE/SkfB family radical SAM enzyme
MKYDLEVDWILLDTCNYRCDYCFSPPDVLSQKLRTYAPVQRWRDSFDALRRTCLLHITGGEPTIYPDFAELCAALTQRHYISVNTNLAHRSVSDFARMVDPSRVAFINAALHLEERDRRGGSALFAEHVDLLRSMKFPLLVSLVATPSALARYEEALELVRPSGVVVVPKLFRGRFNGQDYPESYTEPEKQRFAMFCAAARQAHQPLFERNGEWPTIDMLHDDRYLDGVPTFTGRSCDAGRLLVRVLPNGDVMRCGKDYLGNVLQRSFRPRSRPAPCDTEFCYYFCEKYARPDRSWFARQWDKWQASASRH